MAELIVRRVIQYDEHDETIATFSLAQQYMASEVATGINSDVERGFISPEGARAVLLFLAARLEGQCKS